MKKMKTIGIAATLLFICSVNAQNGSIPVVKIQKLLDKAVGQKYVNTMGNDEKITKQVLTENTYTLYFTGLGKYGSKWVWEYSDIKWDKGFRQYSTEGRGNSKLRQYVFKFEKDMNWYMHVEGETSDKNTTTSLEFYILAKDEAEMDSFIKND